MSKFPTLSLVTADGVAITPGMKVYGWIYPGEHSNGNPQSTVIYGCTKYRDVLEPEIWEEVPLPLPTFTNLRHGRYATRAAAEAARLEPAQ